LTRIRDHPQAFGVPRHDLFQTVDLYEDKNMVQVVLAIYALGGRAQKNRFNGPVIGVKHADANKCVARPLHGQAPQAVFGSCCPKVHARAFKPCAISHRRDFDEEVMNAAKNVVPQQAGFNKV
jgi:hypothetical protein